MKANEYQQKLLQIQKRMDEIRRLDDEQPSRSSAHLYCMNPPLPASRITALEQQYAISLPDEYRLFLQEIGNGSTDQDWGLFSLEDALQSWRDEENDPEFFTKPFVPPVSLANADGNGWEGPGLLVLEHTGCGECSYLVVSGTEYGHIWQGQPAWTFPAHRPDELPEYLPKNNWLQSHDYLLSHTTLRLTFLAWWYQRLCGGW